MTDTTPRDGQPGTTDQSPRWEGPEETRPRGYLPADDDPAVDRDAAGENLSDPDRSTLGDAFTTKERQPDKFPRYDDPAHSNNPSGSPVQQSAPETPTPPENTEYAGHPEFSQDAAANQPPQGIGNSESSDDIGEKTRHSDGVNPTHPSPQQETGAGPALAKHSKDA